MKHVLKTNTGPFSAMWDRRKTAELRNDDRNYRRGDILEMHEMHDGFPTGRAIVGYVSHVQTGYSLKDGHVMLSFDHLSNNYVKRADARQRLGIKGHPRDLKSETSYSAALLADAV